MLMSAVKGSCSCMFSLGMALWLHSLKRSTFTWQGRLPPSAWWLGVRFDAGLRVIHRLPFAAPVHGSGLAPYKGADLKSTIMRHRVNEKACRFPFL